MVAIEQFASFPWLTKAPTVRALQQGPGSFSGWSVLTEGFQEKVQPDDFPDDSLSSLDLKEEKGSSEYRGQEKKGRWVK